MYILHIWWQHLRIGELFSQIYIYNVCPILFWSAINYHQFELMVLMFYSKKKCFMHFKMKMNTKGGWYWKICCGLLLRLTRINLLWVEDHSSITWCRAVMPDMLILLMSMSTLTLLSILMTASPSLSLTLSWNTISSGNLTLRWPGWVRAKKLALRDMTKSYPLQLSG